MKNNQQKSEPNNLISYPVRLSYGKIESFVDIINLFLEIFVFFRLTYFKNRPRVNFLVLRSVILVGTCAGLYYKFFSDFQLLLAGIDIHPIIAMSSAAVIGYWYMAHVFQKKCEACNVIYLEMIKAGSEGKVNAAKAFSCALALELLTVDLWAHRKFAALFARNLYRAVEYAYTLEKSEWQTPLPATKEELVQKINSGNLDAKEARWMLDRYQDRLMHELNQQFAKSS